MLPMTAVNLLGTTQSKPVLYASHPSGGSFFSKANKKARIAKFQGKGETGARGTQADRAQAKAMTRTRKGCKSAQQLLAELQTESIAQLDSFHLATIFTRLPNPSF